MAPYSFTFYKTTSEAWEAMYQAITSASQSVYWEVFIFEDDNIGDRFVALLEEKARVGVEVKIVIDALGSFAFSKAAETRLTQAGVDVRRYNKLDPEWKVSNWLQRVVHRNHRKVLIVDREIVFLGGVNVADRFNTWDDVYLKLVGPMTWPLVRAFAKSYMSAGGNKKIVRHLLHPKLMEEYPEWKKKFRFITHSPLFRKRSATRRMFLKGLEMAKESVNLITPYYVPDKAFLRALAKARKRGVKVSIFLPLRVDHKIMDWIARAYYALTVQAGAEIYLLPTMNHGKAMSVDSKVGYVGSSNLTRRSFYLDEESGVTFEDEAMVGELNRLFSDWKDGAHRFDSERWHKRSIWSRIKEWWAKRIEDYL